MDNDIRVGVLIPILAAQWGDGTDPRELIGFAVDAEALGYDSVWVNDSLLSPRIEALTMLAAAAPVTERVALGTAALLPVLRRPVQAAQTLASIDLLSGGRLIAAVGAGFPGRFGRPLHDLSGVPWRRRFARLDETIALWRHLWAGESPRSFHGEFVRIDNVPAATRPYQKGGPPLWLAGATPAAMERTGRLYDGWLPYPPVPADYRVGLAQIRRSAGHAGRNPDAISPALFVTVLVDETAERASQTLEAYSKVIYGLPVEELKSIQAVATGTPDDVIARLAGYIDAGARHLVCRIGTVDIASQRSQLRLLADLLPSLRRRR